jgi:hyperosmotically inducible protein
LSQTRPRFDSFLSTNMYDNEPNMRTRRTYVDTDANGIVWLTGSARSQQAIDQAISIARETEGVKSVHSELIVRADD